MYHRRRPWSPPAAVASYDTFAATSTASGRPPPKGASFSEPTTLPLEWLWTGKEYTERVVMGCVGVKAFGVESNQIHQVIEFIGAYIFNVRLPSYINKKGEVKSRLPGPSTIDTYDTVADELCNIKSLMVSLMGSKCHTISLSMCAAPDSQWLDPLNPAWDHIWARRSRKRR